MAEPIEIFTRLEPIVSKRFFCRPKALRVVIALAPKHPQAHTRFWPVSWGSQPLHNRRTELLEVSRIPGVDGLDPRLQSAARNQGVIDRATDDACFGGVLDRGMILVSGERDEREMLPNVLQKEQHLIAA